VRFLADLQKGSSHYNYGYASVNINSGVKRTRLFDLNSINSVKKSSVTVWVISFCDILFTFYKRNSQFDLLSWCILFYF
jgi:hypothetical protein